ncbi:MAG: isoleucine--tRNA ligase [Patescibacteria group bacterium]
MFKEVDSKMNLPEIEERILDFWDENKTFQKSIEQREDSPAYSFFDGPPFATGTPHYGHIVASTMKDVVPRYWTMRGYRVDRKWGWDCHGLPIENIAEKELGITHKKEIEEMGVDKFNAVCRSKVLGYVGEWEKAIRRLGRWADMKNSYKTMDLPYMESVWWVFKTLWDKGLIYEGYRSMHICPRCETTLSQSEVAEGYKMVKDISVIAEFKLADDPETSVLAWTTTPWTLIGNVALAVGKEIKYVKIEKKDQGSGRPVKFILAQNRVKDIFGDDEYKIVEEFKGSDLVGLSYKPLFDYYAKQPDLKNKEHGWHVVDASFVTTEEGTGVVHIAPAFGEDDMKLGQEKCLPFVQHVGMDGVIKPEAGEFAGMHVKAIDDYQKTDVEIIKYLDRTNQLFSKAKFEHSYPHCWRCDTPLLNYATSSWFVDILALKDDAINLAKEINWSPKHIKEGRFGKWLEGARDWSISRQRFWASVIPIWRCEECGELIVLGSVAELEQLSGQKVVDLHKDVVDKIAFPCPKCKSKALRIPDVLDTWFDSGSMPYAELHYPFENEEKFNERFPAHFIAEGQDQTRAWFYYLHVLATALKKSIAFKHVIVNGIVLAEDGKKMSKRLQNYPDPAEMFDKYGADVIRFYLLSSPVMQAENLNFSESDMAEFSRGMFRMMWNSYSFFVLYANIDKWEPAKERKSQRTEEPNNVLDQWILSELHTLIKNVNKGMEEYNLTATTRLFPSFIDNLSNWYIRRSRKRFWKSESDEDKEQAYHTLYEILVTLAKLIAPFTPFLAEEIYKNLTGEESVHLADYPSADEGMINEPLNLKMAEARKIVEAGLSLRSAEKVKVRQPLALLKYSGVKLDSQLEEIIADEVNIKAVSYLEGGEAGASSVALDFTITPELKAEGVARDLIRSIQALRKKADFKINDRIYISYQTDSKGLEQSIEQTKDLISKEVLAKSMHKQKEEAELDEEYDLPEGKIWVGIRRDHGNED